MKRFTGLFLTIVMILCTAGVITSFAAAPKATFTTELTVGHLPGDVYKSVTKEDCIATQNAEVTEEGVRIYTGGSATFGFSSRFAMRSVKLVYEGASGKITIKTAENTYETTEAKGSGEHTVVFGENLGLEKQRYWYNNQTASGYYRDYTEKRGEHEITVSTTGGILLKEMVFEKDKVPVLLSVMGEPDLTENEKMFMSTVIMDENASALVVNGATRYIDNNDPGMKPYNDNGTLYIPINTLAKALGYYVEDYPEKEYALLRNDTREYVMLEGKHMVQAGVNDPEPAPFAAIIHHDGKTLAAVRYFAELAGETVVYDEGTVIIDDKYVVKNIMETESYLNYAKGQLVEFKKDIVIGNTYYVSQNSPIANDDNDGSMLTPFKTIGKAAAVAKAGDTVVVREGVYRETLTPKNNGTATAPITYRAAEGEKVVISANEPLESWAQTDDGKYVTKMSWDMGVTRNMVFVDGEPMSEARHPNGPGVMPSENKENINLNNNLWPTRGDLYRVLGSDDTRDIVRSETQLWQEEDYWKGGIFVCLSSFAWSTNSGNIIASKPGELTIGLEKTDRQWWIQDNDSKFNYGFIVGHINALDAPEEWVRENGNLFMLFPEGKNPENCMVEAKARNLVIDLDNKKFVNVFGFDTIGGSVRTNNAEMCMLNGLNMKYISHYMHTANQHSGYIDFDYEGTPNSYGDYTSNENDPNGAPERGVVGNYISGKNNIFVNGHIDHSAGAGLYLTGLYSYIENNILNDCGYMGSYVSGINIMDKKYEADNALRGGHLINNNTVYNCGRSNLNIEENGENVPFLPMDIGYNDFHDGMLASADTGITYSFDANMGYDGITSSEHHNYVYLTTDPTNANPFSNGIYHDNGSFSLDSFKNVMFYTEKDGGFSMNSIYEQSMDHMPAGFLKWDNNALGYLPDGIEALTSELFAEGKPYFAGCLQGVDYTKNYEKFKENKEFLQVTAKDGELSEGITIDKESGYASFTGNGQYIKFADVDFGDISNRFAISVRGDNSYTYDVVEVIIGEEIETGTVYETEVQIEAPERDIPSIVGFTIRPVSGKHNVYIRVKDYRSVDIGGFTPYYLENVVSDEYAAFIYGGSFSEWVKFDEDGSTYSPPTPKAIAAADPGVMAMNNTWMGYYVKYSEIEFKDDSDSLAFVGGSGGKYVMQPMGIYIDGIENKNLVGKFNVEKTPFTNTAIQMVELDKVISQGTHDVYLKFEVDEEIGYEKSSDVRTLGFVKKGIILDEFSDAKTKIYGSEFDATLSTQKTGSGFRTEYMNPPNYTIKGLTNTMPGTVAGYKGVKIPFDVTEFVINYSSDKGVDGQPIEVRVGSPDSEPIASFVTEGEGMMEFNKLFIELDKPLQAGVYDVYLSFGGSRDAKLNAKIEWFGFSY